MFYVFLCIFYVFIVMKLLFLILFKAPISGCERYRIVLLLLLSLLVNRFSYRCIKASLTPFDEIVRRGVDFRLLCFRRLVTFGQGHNHDVIRLFNILRSPSVLFIYGIHFCYVFEPQYLSKILKHLNAFPLPQCWFGYYSRLSAPKYA